ncbi:MAG: hypothetical protein JEZ06_15230 [Anaerolineaceae bacterium]|nr:hypothetical protein [Anaerolineaceae bacterium]
MNPFEFRIKSKSGKFKWLATNNSQITWDGKSAIMMFAGNITILKNF